MNSLPCRCYVPYALLCLAVTGAWGLANRPWSSAHAGEPEAPRADPVALKGLDPVLLIEGKEVKGQADRSVTRDGFRYLFADAINKSKFEKDPQRYAIQFHGHCAMMPSAPAQPDIFTVYKGRIYAFGSEGCQAAFREEPEKYTKEQSQENSHRRRNVAILIFDGMELLDFAGPAEVFASAGFRVYTVAPTQKPAKFMGLTLTPHYTFADCPRPDIVVIPGGSTAVSNDKRVTEWVVQASAEAEATLSVCTGVFVLAKAGLLDGKEATTHWGSIARLRKQFPKITVHDDRRVVDNGKVITSAGVSAGIDGALHVVERLSGRPAASRTARYMEYRWQPVSAVKN
jgi:putative intracellular protease/amidase/YHS domain-containing protein